MVTGNMSTPEILARVRRTAMAALRGLFGAFSRFDRRLGLTFPQPFNAVFKGLGVLVTLKYFAVLLLAAVLDLKDLGSAVGTAFGAVWHAIAA